MTSSVKNSEAVESLQLSVAAFLQRFNVELLSNAGAGPELSFGSGRYYFDRIINLIGELAGRDLSPLSGAKIKEITAKLSEIDLHFERIRGFSISQNPSDPRRVVDSYLQQLPTLYDTAFDIISPVIGYLEVHAGILTIAKDQALGFVQKIESQVSDSMEASKQLKELLRSSQEAAKKLGIVEHAKDFQSEADHHNTASRLWLFATLLAMIGILSFGYLNYSATSDALNNAMMFGHGRTTNEVPLSLTVQFALAKLVIFSILISGVLWCGRVYKAHRHNFVVNKHRVNALNSFSTFAKSAGEDQQIKNAVLLQATQCIYTPQSTGFVTGDAESEGTTKILELFREIPKG